jgi:cytochrome c553
MNRLNAFILTLGLTVPVFANEAAPSDAPAAAAVPVEEKAKVCAACHGADGNETLGGTYPRIAGQYESYIEHAIKEYKSGRRENAIMGAQAQNLSDADIAELAAYFSHLPGRLGVSNRAP